LRRIPARSEPDGSPKNSCRSVGIFALERPMSSPKTTPKRKWISLPDGSKQRPSVEQACAGERSCGYSWEPAHPKLNFAYGRQEGRQRAPSGVSELFKKSLSR